ncbi:MAG TPA: NmrA family NAD(P)-binding protein [Candidatus Limnocylindrales bacterium]|nr:NmrA family NAD(P)-binding protein [Candidatus Limnocylindrales bacterium]
MLLLVGGTGTLGGRVAARLAADSVPFRVLVREGSDAVPLQALGAEVARGDLRDPASLARALAGVRTVVTTANAMARNLSGDRSISIDDVDQAGNANLVAAATEAGVDRFVFVSIHRSALQADTPFTRAKRATEAALADAPFRTVIVRPAAFMEVWLSPMVGVDLPHDAVRIFGEGHARHPMVAVDDCAAAIVRLATMDDPPAEAVLTGPDAVSSQEIAELWGTLTGRPVRVRHVPRAALVVGNTVLRPFRPALSSTMGLALHDDRTEVAASPETMRQLGVEPRSIRAYLAAIAGGAPAG